MKNFTWPLLLAAIITALLAGVNQFTKADLGYYPTRNLVYINVWEEWCQPCVQELPELTKLQEKYPAVQGFLVSDETDVDKAKALLEKLKVQGFREIYSNEKTTELQSLFNQQESQAVPKHIILNDGKVVYQKVGSGPEVLKEIEEQFKKYTTAVEVTVKAKN